MVIAIQIFLVVVVLGCCASMYENKSDSYTIGFTLVALASIIGLIITII